MRPLNLNELFPGKNRQFTRDIELGFNYRQTRYPSSFVWARIVDCSKWSDEASVPVDISQIPPSIFLLTISNSMTSGFELYVPNDISYVKFFERLVEQFSGGYMAATVWSPGEILSSFLFSPDAFDLDYIDQHGIIPNRMKWNRYLARKRSSLH